MEKCFVTDKLLWNYPHFNHFLIKKTIYRLQFTHRIFYQWLVPAWFRPFSLSPGLSPTGTRMGPSTGTAGSKSPIFGRHQGSCCYASKSDISFQWDLTEELQWETSACYSHQCPTQSISTRVRSGEGGGLGDPYTHFPKRPENRS